jgi:hypothetical protein
MLLHRFQLEADRGQSLDGARLPWLVRLPIAARRALARQFDAWTSDAVARRLTAIEAAAANVRGRPDLARPLATRLLWALAQSAARGRASSA